jgi:succinoglycan biosynthesis transport protein ExoP
MVVSDGRIDVETGRLAELSGQLLAAQIAAGDSGARTQASRDSSDRMQEVLSNPLVSSLKSDLARQEALLVDLTSRLGDRHPDVEKARANIVQLKSRLDAETGKVVGGVAVTNTLAATKLAQVKAAFEAQRTQVAQLKEQRDQLALLQRDVDNANQAYSTAVARAGQTELQSQGRQTNVAVIQEATPPARPFKPRLLLGIVLGVFAGLLLGLGFALTRELVDQRLRGDDDVAVWLDQPLLGVLPARAEPARRPRASRMKTRLSWGH